MSHVLTLLQELLDNGRAPSTLKFYVPAIAPNHSFEAGHSIGRTDLVVKFLRGTWRLNPPRPQTVPTWDLSIVPRALRGPAFELLYSADLRPMSLNDCKEEIFSLYRRCYCPGLCLSRLAVPHRCEGTLHQRNGLLLGVVQRDFYW